MKKSTLLLFAICLSGYISYANGLEGIIVERYYISDSNDTSVDLDGGTLPVGSVTYRIYVDLLPGYEFQAAFGIVGHPMKIQTTTTFFNNEDRGAVSPTYTAAQAKNNTVMLDSWLSTGAACAGHFGILKSADNGVGTFVNNDGVLLNNDSYTGIPLTSQDGLIAGAPQVFTKVNIDNEILVFGNINQFGNSFVTSNGSWASLSGSKGPDSLTGNKVLIAQMTTDGIFSFELNIQVGTPSGGIEQYVANNPTGLQIMEPSLTYKNDPDYTNLNVKTFIQGFYLGGGVMNASIDQFNLPEASDTASLQLASAIPPHSIVASATGILSTGGNAQFKFDRTLGLIDDPYYLIVRHRNSIATWSSGPVLFNPDVTYDFTDDITKAYGSNLVDLGDGSFGMYSGDVSDPNFGAGYQDGIIESQDYSDMENAVYLIVSGYVPEDITGDGVVESSDYSLIENSVYFVVSVLNP